LLNDDSMFLKKLLRGGVVKTKLFEKQK